MRDIFLFVVSIVPNILCAKLFDDLVISHHICVIANRFCIRNVYIYKRIQRFQD